MRIHPQFALFACLATLPAGDPASAAPQARQLVINTTDLYVPSQDGGDNFDLVTPYGLEEIRQLLVVLDGNHHLRDPVAQRTATVCADPSGTARDPGFIAVAQLDHIFARRTPWCIGPWTSLRNPQDDLRWIPANEQVGIDAFLDALRAAPAPVHLTVFGSSRIVAAALNREPELLRQRVAMVHFCAGTAAPPGDTFLEWNIGLDQNAAYRVLSSDLPITLYPCAVAGGPFALGCNNGFWLLPDLRFLTRLHPRLRSYLVHQLAPSPRMDVLRSIEAEPDPHLLETVMARRHNVWETCVWLNISGRQLVRRSDGSHRIIRRSERQPGDIVLPNRFVPCRLHLGDGSGRSRTWFDRPCAASDLGLFAWEPVDRPSGRWMYDRGDPVENQRALQEALPELYASFLR